MLLVLESLLVDSTVEVDGQTGHIQNRLVNLDQAGLEGSVNR